MTAGNWIRIKQFFNQALELPPDKRQEFIKKISGEDSSFAASVQEMLDALESNPDWLETPVIDLADVFDPSDEKDLLIGTTVGAFRVEKVIGHGGMGVVYLGRRDDESFRQVAAVKVLKRGMDTASLLERFRAERQTLAAFNHPYISRLLDGGSTEDGRPYFIMEYIEGQPINYYCDAHQLPVDDRLVLFLKICEAVQYAHQNMVVHRDIKPGNILITSDGKPKLLDFGIAKMLVAEPSAQTTDLTEEGLRFLTPEFASPEQIRGEQISTASDVYSLGVLLYLLVTGHQPYYFRRRTPTSIEKIICESIPDNPSSIVARRIDSHGEKEPPGSVSAVETARLRRTTPEKLSRRLAGDLDNIIQKALSKEPERRYAFVDQFAGDIRNYLNGLPVSARRSTLRYRSAKFIGRHRAAFVSLTLFVLLLVISVIAISWQERRASREASRAQRTVAYLRDMLASSDPYKADRELTVVELLDRAADNIETGLKNDPLIEAEVRSILAKSYQNYGRYNQALLQLQRALEINQEIYGKRSPAVAANLHDLGLVQHYLGKFESADSLYLRSVGLYRELATEPSRGYAEALNDRGLLLLDIEKYSEAKEWLGESLAMFRRISDQENIAIGINNLAYTYDITGDYREAEKLYREALQLNRQLHGEVHLSVARNLNNLGSILMHTGDTTAAVQVCEQSLHIRQKILGDDHPDVAIALHNVAHLKTEIHQFKEAAVLERQALAIFTKSMPEDHPYLAQANILLGQILIAQDSLAEAEKSLRKALGMRRKKFGEDNISVAEARVELGACLVLNRRFAEAERLLLDAHSRLQEASPQENRYYRKQVLVSLVDLYTKWGKTGRAKKYQDELQQLQN